MTVPKLIRLSSNRLRDLLVAAILLLLLAQNGLPALRALAQGGSDARQRAGTALTPAFTYQGRLEQGGIAQDGIFDFEFSLFDAASGGVALATLPPFTNVTVAHGLFTVRLNFGAGQFNGEQRWLEVRAKPAGGGVLELLGRQELTATPYAIYALNIPEHSHLGEVWVDSFGLGPVTFGDGVNDPAISLFHNSVALKAESIGGDAIVGTAYTEGRSGLVGMNDVFVGCAIATPCYGVRGTAPAGAFAAGVFGTAKVGVRGESLAASCPSTSADASDFCLGMMGTGVGAASAGLWGEGQKFGVVGKVVTPLQSESAGVLGVQGAGQWAGRFLGDVKAEGFLHFGASLRQMINLWSTSYGIGVQDFTFYQRSGHTFAWFTGGSHVNGYIDPGPGGTRQMRLNSDGNLLIRGVYGANGADFAELVTAESGVEAGDVLVIGGDGVMQRSSTANDARIAGVFSTKPGFVGGSNIDADSPDSRIPLAVTGIVPVKVSGENGPIRPGDMLVASTVPGHAMRAGPNPAAGTVLGKSLGSFEGFLGVVSVLLRD
jgi:hypothetical protein